MCRDDGVVGLEFLWFGDDCLVIPCILYGMNSIWGLLSKREALHKIILRTEASLGEFSISLTNEVILIVPVPEQMSLL